MVQASAGGAGLPDAAYEAAGAEIAPGADQIFQRADLIVKVKGAARKQAARAPARADPVHLPSAMTVERNLLRPAGDWEPFNLTSPGLIYVKAWQLEGNDYSKGPPTETEDEALVVRPGCPAAREKNCVARDATVSAIQRH